MAPFLKSSLLLAPFVFFAILGCAKNDTADDETETKQSAVSPEHQNTRKRNLHRIGVAFFNYHDAYNTFPAADSNGFPKGSRRKNGLSWRVYLLPFLGQKRLYEQFQLDESWDSQHNKRLISQMPDVYSSPGLGINSKEGKTAIHVFVGENTFFGMHSDGVSVGAKIRDVTDGISVTFLAVEAGANTAEIWTKPGGLPFDAAKDPYIALGNIPEAGFLALAVDGEVHFIERSTPPDVLKALVQHADGGAVSNRNGRFTNELPPGVRVTKTPK